MGWARCDGNDVVHSSIRHALEIAIFFYMDESRTEMVSENVFDPILVGTYDDLSDSVDGPFFVCEDQSCTYCGAGVSVTVDNVRKERVYEICRCCGFEKDYGENETVN